MVMPFVFCGEKSIMIGKTISHYKILEKLGEGGMGVVYKAEDTKLKRTVVLKFLPKDLTRDTEARERFVQEARAAAALSHPNICTIHEIDEVKGQFFIVMEYIEGQNLREKIESGPHNIDEAVDIAIQVADGLQEAHEKGIVHRDIKSANIMVTEKGQAKIMDFGMAKLAGKARLTKTGTTIGTVAYMSPEQTKGEEVDHRTDIWSLGVVLYEMVTGQLPFKGEYEQTVVYSIMNKDAEPMTGLRTGVSLKFERIVNRCMEKEPTERYQTAGDLITDLRHVQRIMAAPTPRPRPAVPPKVADRAARRWPWVAALAVGAALTLVILLRYLEPTKREPISERKMIAVLPFENLGPPEDEYFAEGITEEIMARLANIQKLGVIARTSSIQYRNTDKTIQQIGEELGVDYILEGTVRWQRIPHDPSRVRVTPQLIRVADATHLWANVYENDMADIFEVQSVIAEQVAEALDITLLEPERRSLEDASTDNLEAYDYYLRGNDYYNRGFAEQDLLIAVQMYENAVKLDPAFALAYAQLSKAHASIYWFYYDRTEERLIKAKEAVDKALELKPDLPEAHLALGEYYYRGHLEYDHALNEFAIAQKSQPNNSDLFALIGWVKRRQGRFEEALANLKKASELDPRSNINVCNLAQTYYLMRNYPDGERCFDKVISITPDWPRPYAEKAWLYLSWEGNVEKARESLEMVPDKIGESGIVVPTWILLDVIDGKYQKALDRLSSISSEAFETQFYFVPKAQLYAQIYGLMNKTQLEQAYYDSARKILEARIQERPEDARFHSALGILYAGLGRKQEAIREAEKAVELLPISKEAYRGIFRVEDLARVYVMAGEYDAAIDQLEFLLSIPGRLSIPWLRVDPIWAPLRDNARFQKLLEGGK
jgi:serine/threonine protein kinase/tetratricopeptide (TPR) repeat protein